MEQNEQTVYNFEQILEQNGKLVYKTRGTSMQPLIRQNRDLVCIEAFHGTLRPLDTALYKRRDQYVLHRVIKVKDGYYLIRGDNTYALEKVPFGAVIGVLTGFVRKGHRHSVDERGYRLYSRVWTGLYPVRALRLKIRCLLVVVARKTGLYEPLKRLLRRK